MLTIKILRRFIGTVQVNHVFFFTIDTALPADNPLRFRKKKLILL